jgi:hypothetical protein
MPDNEEGKCVSCGLLAKRTAPDHPGLSYYEVGPEERTSGYLFAFPSFDNAAIRCVPCCYAGAAPLAQEITGDVPQSSDYKKWDHQRAGWQQKSLIALSKDRKCPSWVEYIEGLSPQWHLESHQMNLLQKAREEWEMRMEQDRREWQRDFQAQLEQDRREWNEKFQSQSSRLSNQLACAATIFGLLQVIAAIIGLTPDSWLVKLLFTASSNVRLP